MPPSAKSDNLQDFLRQIPSVEALLSRKALRDLEQSAGRRRVLRITQQAVERLRESLRQGAKQDADRVDDLSLERLEQEIAAEIERDARPSLQPLINATGVVLHTNLGRAPLAREAVERIAQVAAQYSNLEYDVDSGRRGKRDVHAQRLFRELTGAEASLVVNNNAAAVFLALNSLAEGAEVIVSRGELVEIGGSFRIPDICAKSGAALREVGTTNRTRAADYAAAVTERTRVLLRVHPSNFRMTGFTERPELAELAALARERGLVLMEDLGSGCLADLAPFGLKDEPLVSDSIGGGADVVTFSGDKLLGGPQAGMILGRRELLQRIRSNPLFRAFRVDKLTLAALEATVALYERGQFDAIPAQRMIRCSREEISRRASHLAGRINALPGFSAQLEDGDSAAGGGSTPGQFLPTRLIAITHAGRSAQSLADFLRQNRPPVIARVESDVLRLDLRTVLDLSQEDEIYRALARAN